MKKLAVFLLCLLIVSCARTYSTKTSHAQDERHHWQAQAEEGDPEAQYRLGNAYCCGNGDGFFDTQKAIEWWCKAVKQDHEKAKQALSQYAKSKSCS